jgi:hypothetical protein
MSGFGIRAFKKIQIEKHNEKKSYVKHIVFGENSFAVLTFLKLNKKYPGEVKLITKNPFYKEELLKEWSCSLSSVRSESVAQGLLALNPRLEIFQNHTEVIFYKDAKFHKFGGRAKPHELKDGEAFFTKAPYQINLAGLFEESDLENLEEILKENQLNRILKEIKICTPEDLVEVANFKLYTGESESIHCEKLYFCESPKTFYSLINDKNTIPDSLQAFIAPITNQQGICVNYICDKKVYEKEGTVILPQSVTHEWGSFMLDFTKFDPEKNIQEFRALTFIGDDELQEDDLAKKIKLMNRVIERVLPEFGNAKVEQSIKYSSEYRISGINDDAFDSIRNENVKFLGQASPLNIKDSNEYQYSSRAITAIISSEL